MAFPWRSSFDLDLPGQSVADVRRLVNERRHRRLSGLRGLEMRGETLRVRYVIGPAVSAPLLKARLVATEHGSRLEGVITWGAVYYGGLLHAVGLTVMSVISFGFAISQQTWQPLAIGALALGLAGLFARSAVRGFAAERQAYAEGFANDLRVMFDGG